MEAKCHYTYDMWVDGCMATPAMVLENVRQGGKPMCLCFHCLSWIVKSMKQRIKEAEREIRSHRKEKVRNQLELKAATLYLPTLKQMARKAGKLDKQKKLRTSLERKLEHAECQVRSNGQQAKQHLDIVKIEKKKARLLKAKLRSFK